MTDAERIERIRRWSSDNGHRLDGAKVRFLLVKLDEIRLESAARLEVLRRVEEAIPVVADLDRVMALQVQAAQYKAECERLTELLARNHEAYLRVQGIDPKEARAYLAAPPVQQPPDKESPNDRTA